MTAVSKCCGVDVARFRTHDLDSWVKRIYGETARSDAARTNAIMKYLDEEWEKGQPKEQISLDQWGNDRRDIAKLTKLAKLAKEAGVAEWEKGQSVTHLIQASTPQPTILDDINYQLRKMAKKIKKLEELINLNE